LEAKLLLTLFLKDSWIKKEFGANYIISDYDKVAEQVKEITQGKMADVVLNSLGIGTWDSSFSSVGINGRWVAFGGLTGADVKLNVQSMYSKQIKLIGSTGSTRKEMQELIDISPELKVGKLTVIQIKVIMVYCVID
jgi:NADPH:quinone reductase-like Zn-dependent oxidoreductase